MNPVYQRPSSYFLPEYASPISNWHGHMPFAYDLVHAARPSLVVELGTHYGDSYFTFCQAVADAGSPARCFAIDHWKGDACSGKYGSEVFDYVSMYNGKYFEDFSELLRMPFGEALETFDDGSISILHIDGSHEYESVKRDFEAWLPKVSPGGVILLHDIVITRKPFGVAQFWDEVRREHPSFPFHHSCGLGVLVNAPGSQDAVKIGDMVLAEGDQELYNHYLFHALRVMQHNAVRRCSLS